MNIPTRSSKNKRVLIIAAAIGLFAVACLAIYVYAFNGDIFGWSPRNNDSTENRPSNDQNKQSAEEQKKAGDDIKKNNSSDTKPGSQSDNPDKSSPEVTEDGKKAVSVTITAAAQNGSTFQVRTLIDEVSSAGSCTLYMVKSGVTVTKVAGLQPMASSSTCEGFDVPISELSSGQWQITVSFSNDQASGNASKIIEIK